MNQDILKMQKIQDGVPVMVAKIPKPIMKEIDEWVRESRKYKDSPLAELKGHENYGYKNNPASMAYNSYQCAVPGALVEKSFWLGWVIRLSYKYWANQGSDRLFKMRSWSGHYDGYDIWTNFSYKGDSNPRHNHAGFLSGVIYYKNHGHPTLFTDYNCGYNGVEGTMLMFPADVFHTVPQQTANKERITLAFNITKLDAETLAPVDHR